MSTTQNPIGRVMLNDVRLSFPALFVPEPFQPGDPPKYKATFLVPKGSKLAAQVDAAIMAVLKASPKVGEKKAQQVLAQIRGNTNKFCWQDGDTKSYDGYEGMMALSAKADTRPTVIDRDKSPLTKEDGRPYAGCYVNASVEFFVYENKGVGVSSQVRGVQFMRDGDAFSGGRPADSDEFEAVTEGAAAEDFA